MISRWIMIVIFLILPLTGCVGSAVENAINTADQQIRLKWSEEWKPALLAEVKETADDTKKEAIQAALDKIELLQDSNEEKLAKLEIQLEDFDSNKDGKLQTGETLALIQELKTKNDAMGNPLSWWDMLIIVASAYLPLTGTKELLKSKLKKKSIENQAHKDNL